jgi:hypothetical protein
MAADNDHARSEQLRQGSTPASHVWTRQLNSQANRPEKRRESFLAVQHGVFGNAKTWPEHGGTRPGIGLEHLPNSRMSGFESRATFYSNNSSVDTKKIAFFLRMPFNVVESPSFVSIIG